MTKDELLHRIDSFSELSKDWMGYDSEPILALNISVAKLFLVNEFKGDEFKYVQIFPMQDGGIQIEYQNEFTDIECEYEIHDYEIKRILFLQFDADITTISYKNKIRKLKLKKLL